MTETAPLTDQQLADIRSRADAATPGPWSTAKDAGYSDQYGETFVANWTGPYLRGVGDISLGVGHEAEADLAFVLAARTDVPALLAEVDRLRAELATAQAKAAAHEHSENLLADILREGRRLLAEAATPEQAVTDLHTLLNP